MFEMEIMVGGYTVFVVTSSVVISKYINRKKINKINNELVMLKTTLLNTDAEIKKLKKDK